MTSYDEKVGANIAALRTAAGMTQTDLARLITAAGLKFYQQQVVRVEHGQRRIRLDEAIIIGSLLGIAVEELADVSSVAKRVVDLNKVLTDWSVISDQVEVFIHEQHMLLLTGVSTLPVVHSNSTLT